jgi:prepilin-type N-terminal cleavage/methylation domain-containing protein
VSTQDGSKAIRKRTASRAGFHPKERGFTFLEVIIALCILGGAVVVVMGNIDHAVTVYRVAREMAVATNAAQAKLQELFSSKDPIKESEESGVIEQDPRFRFRRSVTETALPGFEKEDLKGMFRVEVVVTWDSPERAVRLVEWTGADRGQK